MKPSANYIKIVEWSNEDQCFIGQCPNIIGPCCHGNDEVNVYNELCQIVDEWIEMMLADGKSLPPPTIGNNFALKLLALVHTNSCHNQLHMLQF
jgi:predicted RNase H-like HicB family nuclease